MDRPTDPSLMSRRTWLQASALIGLYAGVGRATCAAALAHGELAADAIVIEAGLPGAASLTCSVEAQARVEVLHDDLAEFFYGRLVPAWRARGVRGLAGLTRAPTLFLLQSLAADYGLRTESLMRAPPTPCAALASLCNGSPRRRRAVNPELLRAALLEGDGAAFAWSMAPVRRSMRAGVM